MTAADRDRDEPRGPPQRSGSDFRDVSVDGPRLTPQGRADPDASGEDATDPMGAGAKTGQSDKAEG
jgi:hypothetical protein